MLTIRQVETLYEIEKYFAETGCAPSLRELCARMGIKGVSGMHANVNRLVKAGRLLKKSGKIVLPNFCPTCGSKLESVH